LSTSQSVNSQPIYSMTGFARTTGRVVEQGDAITGDNDQELASWTMSIKSVNHRFLDLHLRMPSGTDGLEMELRRRIKQVIRRGHLELTLTYERTNKKDAASYDRELVAQFIAAFRAAQQEHGLNQEPDLNVILRLPGAFGSGAGNAASATQRDERDAVTEALQTSVLAHLDGLLDELNQMRASEGAALASILNEILVQLERDVRCAADLRLRIHDSYYQRLRDRLRELLGSDGEDGRLLQEAALLADRSDVEEEIARLLVHIEHFRSLLSAGGEVGKKLDFLLQEMNREANTLLSKSAGIAEEGARITELGLGMKSAIEKIREQVQNLE
jgi:uncharacterized protein (TIGR00255 family)